MKDKIRLIDVGARGGIDSRWEPYHGMLEVIGFEPDPEECAALNSKRHPYSIKFLPAALGAEDGRQSTLFMCSQPGCSSLLEPNLELCCMFPYGDAMTVVDRQPITLQRMDTVCGKFQPDVLKVDTQGTELDVLRGAGRLLDSLLAVEVEVEFVPQYVGQALFSDIDPFLREQGFMLRGIKRTCWRAKAAHLHPDGGQLIHADALYLRPERINCQKGHIILAAYRQHDMLACFGASHLIPRRPFFIRLASRLLSGFTNRELRRFADTLRPSKATDWHDPEFF